MYSGSVECVQFLCVQNRFVPADSVQRVHSHNLFLQLSDCCDTVTTGQWAEDTEQWSPASSQRESQWWTSGTRKQQRNSEISWQTVTGRQRERGACHVSKAEHGCDLLGWPQDSWQRPGEWPEAGAGEQETLVIVWFRGNTGHWGLQVKQQPDFQYKVQPSQAGTETGTDWPGQGTGQPL